MSLAAMTSIRVVSSTKFGLQEWLRLAMMPTSMCLYRPAWTVCWVGLLDTDVQGREQMLSPCLKGNLEYKLLKPLTLRTSNKCSGSSIIVCKISFVFSRYDKFKLCKRPWSCLQYYTAYHEIFQEILEILRFSVHSVDLKGFMSYRSIIVFSWKVESWNYSS